MNDLLIYFLFKMTSNVINVTNAPVLLTAMRTHMKIVKGYAYLNLLGS